MGVNGYRGTAGEFGSTLTGAAAFCTLLYNMWINHRNNRAMVTKVDQIHHEVKTINGLTLGALADAREGRRIDQNVPPASRTSSQQHYVDHLSEADALHGRSREAPERLVPGPSQDQDETE